jgi:hypothetical protein
MTTAPSSAPLLMRMAQTVKQIGELHLQLAAHIERAGAAIDTDARSLVRELVRSVITELRLTPAPEHEPEEPMPILLRDFAYAHARFTIKGDDVLVERSTGVERSAYTTTRPPEPSVCADEPLTIAPRSTHELPRNTKLVRLRLSADHQIDPSEVVAEALPADRDTAYLYELRAIPVNDRTVDVMIRRVDPDMSEPEMVARVHLLLFRVA